MHVIVSPNRLGEQKAAVCSHRRRLLPRPYVRLLSESPHSPLLVVHVGFSKLSLLFAFSDPLPAETLSFKVSVVQKQRARQWERERGREEKQRNALSQFLKERENVSEPAEDSLAGHSDCCLMHS